MSWKLLVKSSAESDILDGFVDYEQCLEGLGERFLDEVNISFDRIESNPYLYQEIEEGIRRSITHTFPYIVFYTIEKDMIFVLAVIHAAQDPKYIANRLIA
jgi:plasmid stabilization system protein ParE